MRVTLAGLYISSVFILGSKIGWHKNKSFILIQYQFNLNLVFLKQLEKAIHYTHPLAIVCFAGFQSG